MGNPIRVLHVVVNMNRGGAETLIMNLYRHIDRTKVQFDFLTCKEGVFDSEILRMGGRIHRIPYITKGGQRTFKKGVALVLRNNPVYQIIHSHLDKMSGIVLQVAKREHVPIRIAHSHNTESEGGIAAKIYKWYAGSLIKAAATHLYACSEAAAKWLFKDRVNDVFVLRNGIDMDKFQYCSNVRTAIRNELDIAADTLVLGHVGRFAPQKNHMFLIDLFAEINAMIPNSVLLLAGDGPLRKKMEAKVQTLELAAHVKFLGIRDDMERLLQAFDQFIFPSIHEGLPVSLIEAQGSGLPCLISDTITTEVDMGAGVVRYLPLKDQGSWVKQILQLAAEPSPRIAAKEALALRGYDIRTTALQTEHAYLQLGRVAL